MDRTQRENFIIIIGIIILAILTIYEYRNYNSELSNGIVEDTISDKMVNLQNYDVTYDEVLNNQVVFEVDGKSITNPHKSTAYINKYQRTMVPFKYFFESIGYSVEWEKANNGTIRVIATKPQKKESTISTKINSNWNFEITSKDILDIFKLFVTLLTGANIVTHPSIVNKVKWNYILSISITGLIFAIFIKLMSSIKYVKYINVNFNKLVLIFMSLSIIMCFWGLILFRLKNIKKQLTYLSLIVEKDVLLIEKAIVYYLNNCVDNEQYNINIDNDFLVRGEIAQYNISKLTNNYELIYNNHVIIKIEYSSLDLFKKHSDFRSMPLFEVFDTEKIEFIDNTSICKSIMDFYEKEMANESNSNKINRVFTRFFRL